MEESESPIVSCASQDIYSNQGTLDLESLTLGLSRLEKYLIILEALIPQPIELEALAFSTNIECRMLKQYLSFLISHQLAEDRAVRSKVVYAINDRGLAVTKVLRVQKYLETLKRVLPVVEETEKSQISNIRTNASNKE